MKQLVEDIAKALVDIPEVVAVREVEGEQVTILELRSGRERSWESDRQTGSNRAFHPHHSWGGGNEAESSVYLGNP